MHGIPTADTYRRLFEKISPAGLEQSFNSWLSSVVEELGAQVIPIDGKTVRGSYDRNGEQSALHLVSPKGYRSETVGNPLGHMLGRVRTDYFSDKSKWKIKPMKLPLLQPYWNC